RRAGDLHLPMRILVLTNLYPPHHYGGYELACRAAVEDWRARGHEVEVITGDHRVRGVAEAEPPGGTRRLRFYWADHELVGQPAAPRRAPRSVPTGGGVRVQPRDKVLCGAGGRHRPRGADGAGGGRQLVELGAHVRPVDPSVRRPGEVPRPARTSRDAAHRR